MNWFGKKKTEEKIEDATVKQIVNLPENKFKLAIVDENAEQVYEILGITEERAAKLSKIVEREYEENDLLHVTLEKIVDECTHTNEIVFATLILTKVQEHAAKKHIAQMFMSHMKGKNNGND